MPVKSFLRDWGIELVYMISGALGGLLVVLKKNNRKRPIWEKVIIILVGILTANYLTPLAVWVFTIPYSVQNGIAFVLGYMGLNTIGLVIDWARAKFKKE